MDCPVCASEATNLTPPTYDGLVIGCSLCGKYRIMRSALADLRSSRIEDRKAALGHARSFASKSWPTLSRACLLENRHKGEDGKPTRAVEIAIACERLIAFEADDPAPARPGQLGFASLDAPSIATLTTAAGSVASAAIRRALQLTHQHRTDLL